MNARLSVHRSLKRAKRREDSSVRLSELVSVLHAYTVAYTVA